MTDSRFVETDPTGLRFVKPAAKESRFVEDLVRLSEEGPPPFAGAVFDKSKHRWVKGPQTDAPAPAPAPAAHPDAARQQKDAAAAEHYLASAQERPRSKAAAAADKYKDVARRRRVLAGVKNEGELAQAIGGHNNPDSEPADVTHMLGGDGQPVTDAKGVRDALTRREAAVKTLETGKVHLVPRTGGAVVVTDRDADDQVRAQAAAILQEPAEFFEVKTLLTSAKDHVYMNPAALARKRHWAKKYAVNFHLVAVDQRQGAKFSGHRVYVLPAADLTAGGTVKLADMKKAGSMGHVLAEVKK